MASATTTPGLTDAQLVDSFAPSKGGESVELKLTVPISNRSHVGPTLRVDPSTQRPG